MLGLCCCRSFSLIVLCGVYSLHVLGGLLIAVASLVTESTGSVDVGSSCPEIEPMSPELAGGFFTTEPPGTLPLPIQVVFFFLIFIYLVLALAGFLDPHAACGILVP